MTSSTPHHRPRRTLVALLATLVMVLGAVAGAAGAQEAPPASVPPDLPVVTPPADPSAPPPPPPAPIADPSPQVAVLLTRLHILDLQHILGGAQATLDQAQAVADRAKAFLDAATRDRDRTRKALTDAATTAYVQGGLVDVSELDHGSISDFVAAESQKTLAGSAIDHARSELQAAEARLQAATTQYRTAQQQADDARAARDAAQAALDDATNSLATPPRGTDLSPTVLGDSTLTPDEIVGWYQTKGVQGWNAKVDLATMAGYYVTEGQAEGVRGDVAFAQAMVETGAFTSPLTGHNNFAGIGACDSCATGFDFPSPQLGVRAQMQLLHAYADRALTLATLANPSVGANPDHLSVRGCCATWNKLTGTWATDPNYGPKIMTIYQSMLEFALALRTSAATAPVPPVP